MRFCTRCGKEIADQAAVCIHCGRSQNPNDAQNGNNFSTVKYCAHCGKEIASEAVVCIHCGYAVAQPAVHAVPAEDKVSIGYCILAFLFPIFGFIFWGVKHRETPKRARACGITAIVSYILNLIIALIAQVLLESLYHGIF